MAEEFQSQAKALVRKLIKERKQQLSKDEQICLSEKIVQHIEQCEAFRTAHSVLCYWPLADEVQIEPLIDKYWQTKQFYLPVVHDQVAQSESTGNTTGSLRNFFLYATVGDKGINFMTHPVAETGSKKTFGNSSTNCHRVSLSERTGGIFNTAFHIYFRVTRSYAAPLAKLLQIIE